MSKVILYTRCSTTKTESDTRASQLTELRQYAAQNNLEVVGEFSDLCSGRELECRTGLLSALELASVENASIAAVELSRLSRNVADVANLLNSDTSIILTRSSRHLSKEMWLIMAVFAEAESDAISRRVKAGIKTAFETNPDARSNWGRANDPKAVEDLTRGRIAKADRFALQYGPLAYGLFQTGMPYRAIGHQLETANIKTSRGGARWSYSSVRQLIERYVRLAEIVEEKGS